MANTKMFVHFGGTLDAFKALANKSSYDNKIVFIKGGNDGKGAAIYTHGEFYTSAHAVEALVSSLKAISGVMVNGDASTLKVATSHDGVLNFSNGDETVAVTMDGPGIKISVSKAFRDRVTAVENSLGVPVANDKGNAAGTAYERIAKLASDVAALGGASGSIASQINAALDALDFTDTEAAAGKYVSSVAQVNGKISVSHEALPTYTLVEGATNGTVKFNNTEVKVHGLGSAAYTDASAYDAAGTAGAVDSKLTTHVNDKVAHITADERQKWNDTKAAVDIFLGDNLGKDAQDVIDTLKDIQGYITNDGAAADALVKRVADLEKIDHDAYKAADEAKLTEAKQYVDGRFTNEVTGKFDIVGSANAAKEAAIAHAEGLVLDSNKNPKFEAVGVAEGLVKGLAEGAVKANADAITVINGEGDGSIAKAKADAMAYADLLFAWEEINA
jgi:hypothetical protein